MYDYLIVGSGLFGSVFAYEATKKGKKVLVIDKRNHVGGNIYTKESNGVNIHQYGAHIFHTNNKKEWDYINQFAEFNNFTNCPIANYKGELYNLPFNMNTFNSMWGVKTPSEAKAIINKQKLEITNTPKNLEEQAISLIGRDVYEKLIKGYTEKQWGRAATELPTFIIKRVPVRFTFDNNYFNDRYQGIPIGGYTQIIDRMLKKCDVHLNVDFFKERKKYEKIAKKIVFTGMIDEYFNYCFGNLEYRSLRFETQLLDNSNYQGVAVVNYTEYDIPYTRIIEHKHFECGNQELLDRELTYITKEYPIVWKLGDEPFYPVNNSVNDEMYTKYQMLAMNEKNVIFGGRLAMYKYYDMNNIIKSALECADKNI